MFQACSPTNTVQILYDFYVLVLIVVNALQRFRRHDSEIIGNLFRDGGYMFMVCGSARSCSCGVF